MKLVEANLEDWTSRMREIAKQAHAGQKRKNGTTDYFEGHIEPVSNAVPDRQKPIAYGHDLCEDTYVTLEQLIEMGFPSYITDAIDVLTHRNNDPNVLYWSRIAKNKDAAIVKIADMRHNLSDAPDEKQKEKYLRGLAFFKDQGYNVE